MRLSDCVEQIKKIYFKDQGMDVLNNFVFHLLHELKYKHFIGEDYPRSGWLISLAQDKILLIHKEASVDLNPILNKSHKRNSRVLYQVGQQ